MKLTSSAGKFDGASFSAFALEHLQMGGSGAKPCCFALAVLPCVSVASGQGEAGFFGLHGGLWHEHLRFCCSLMSSLVLWVVFKRLKRIRQWEVAQATALSPLMSLRS